MRTPEETARLANGVTVETPSGAGTITPKVIEWGERRILSHAVMPGIDKEEALVCLAADRAEARAEVARVTEDRDLYQELAGELQAEVAALREVAGLVREWQAAEAALRLAADDPWRIGGAVAAVEAIEARLLAATLPEVRRG